MKRTGVFVLLNGMWGELVVVAYRSHLKGLWIPAHQRAASLDLATVWLDK